MPVCKNCSKEFPTCMRLDGRKISLTSREYCLECNPLGERKFWGGKKTNRTNGNPKVNGRGQGWAKGLEFPGKYKKSLEEILVYGNKTQTNKLKQRLIKENIFEYKCYNCNLTKWLDGPIPLELHHISGDRADNRLENLTLLCPNCHSLTPTNRGKNVRCKREKLAKELGIPIEDVGAHTSKTDIPITDEKLSDLISVYPSQKIGKMFDLSGEVVRQICRRRNIEVPQKQYLTSKRNKKHIDVSDEELQELVKANSLKKVALILNETEGIVRANCKRRNIQICDKHFLQMRFFPTKEELLNKMEELKWNFSAAGKFYNVTDNSVRKRCKKFGLIKPCKYYTKTVSSP